MWCRSIELFGVTCVTLTEFFVQRSGLVRGSCERGYAEHRFVRARRGPRKLDDIGDPQTWERSRSRAAYRASKRGFDVFFSALGIALLLPLGLLIAIASSVDGGGPLFFSQWRPGGNGKPFRLWKFRTLPPRTPTVGRQRGDVQRDAQGEARVTALGAFLRRTHLDELPQLWNILRGEMSFVGPRPLLSRDQPRNPRLRQSVPPGLTGWAQVVAGRSVAPEAKAALDAWYVAHASFWLDLWILMRTLRAVALGEQMHPGDTATNCALAAICTASRDTVDAMAIEHGYAGRGCAEKPRRTSNVGTQSQWGWGARSQPSDCSWSAP